MASVEEKVGGPATDDGFAEEVLVDGEMLGPEVVDPDSSRPDPEYITSKQLKEESEEGGKKSGGGVAQNLKSTLIISGAAVAVIGAIFAIAKKIKEA
ncbi:hypothetical protein PHJA_001370100 [Phtheirospermum japonicum]|uniref:Uncharacterized protein n=1 Tax=Phtheirospermum japonicum TaxID=374723 RepID=A0A830BXS8_9LAMI|nr:hypothetical protein PHJA_001370100 [Phtheirospermum japonicum]